MWVAVTLKYCERWFELNCGETLTFQDRDVQDLQIYRSAKAQWYLRWTKDEDFYRTSGPSGAWNSLKIAQLPQHWSKDVKLNKDKYIDTYLHKYIQTCTQSFHTGSAGTGCPLTVCMPIKLSLWSRRARCCTLRRRRVTLASDRGLHLANLHTSPLDQIHSFIINSTMTSLYLFFSCRSR